MIKKISKIYPIIDIARALETNFDIKQAQFVLAALKDFKIAELFLAFSLKTKQEIIDKSNYSLLKTIWDDMYSHDVANIIKSMPEDLKKKILLSASNETRKKIQNYKEYPADQVGSIMNAEILKLNKDISISEAMTLIKASLKEYDASSMYYVTDENGFLVGGVKLENLAFAENRTAKLSTLVDESIISINVFEQIDELINLFYKYEIEEIVVVDSDRKIVGIISDNDIMPIKNAEITEDIYLMAGITKLESTYMQTSVFKIVKSRILWLTILMISTTITTIIIDQFIHLSTVLTSGLTTLMLVPLITTISGTTGNAGSQSSTSIIRVMALGNITPKEYMKSILKEFNVGLLSGFLLAIINFIRLAIYYAIPAFQPDINDPSLIGKLNIHDPYLLGLIGSAISSLALFITIVLSKTLGAILPIIATKCKIDPSVMAAPLISTILDSISSLVLLGLGVLIIWATICN